MSKYHAKKVVIDVQKFDSMKEASRGMELKMLERAGKIQGLQFQVSFELQPSFKVNGKTERAITYVADAVYLESGKKIVEDTKSAMTRKLPVYAMKRKMLLFKYQDIVFRENT